MSVMETSMEDFEDFDFTREKLAAMLPGNQNIDEWYAAMCKVLPKYEITTAYRVASFVAQCAHESANFRVLRENLNYRWSSLRKVFPRHFPTDAIAQEYAHKPERIANRAYANRMGNGPEASGDGWRYCGRGLIQLTGKNNYTAFARYVDMPLEDVPAYLMSFEGAVESACWFWTVNKLNVFADRGDIKTMSRVINGGYNGLEDRIKKYRMAYTTLVH
jgi:putative chitinase